MLEGLEAQRQSGRRTRLVAACPRVGTRAAANDFQGTTADWRRFKERVRSRLERAAAGKIARPTNCRMRKARVPVYN